MSTMDSCEVEKRYFIYFAAFTANLITIGVGSCGSWTSPVLPKLQSNDTSINPLTAPITIWEESLVASSSNLAAFFTTFLVGVLCEKLGKKRSLLLFNLPMIGAHVLCTFASHVYLFIAARVLMGITAGGVATIVPAFLSEIADVNERGLLGSMFGGGLTIGLTFVYVVGPFLSINAFSLVNLVVPMLFLLLFGLFVPESPFDLVRRGEMERALNSLMKLRGKSAHHVVKEFTIISETYFPTKNRNWMVLLESKPLKKGLIISVTLIILEKFTGISVVIIYMQSIFEAAGSSISPIYAPMIISVVQMVTNLISLAFIERAGRRPLLIISTTSCILGLGILAGYFQVKDSGIDVTLYGWLPLAALFIFIIAFNVGQANIPWIMPTELFPPNLKTISSSVATLANLLVSFIVILLFPSLSEWLGMAGPFFIFVAVLSVGLVFIVMVVPETKGKDALEIQRLLEG